MMEEAGTRLSVVQYQECDRDPSGRSAAPQCGTHGRDESKRTPPMSGASSLFPDSHASLAVPAGQVKLEQIALSRASSDRQQELIAAEAGPGHPRFANEPTLTVNPEPDTLHRSIAAPGPEGHVWNRSNH